MKLLKFSIFLIKGKPAFTHVHTTKRRKRKDVTKEVPSHFGVLKFVRFRKKKIPTLLILYTCRMYRHPNPNFFKQGIQSHFGCPVRERVFGTTPVVKDPIRPILDILEGASGPRGRRK